MSERNSFTYRLSEAQQTILGNLLKNGNYRPVTVPHAKFAARTRECTVAAYGSGKCLIQGKGAQDFVLFVLEPFVLKSAQLGYEDILNPEAAQAHMGIDESGKGDFFGPIVVAGAYVDESLVDPMRRMNVRDSKSISSDNAAIDLGRELRALLGRRYNIVRIGPQAYNRLYFKMRNVNSILAWAHARAIENLLEVLPGCPRAISDQFGSKEQVKGALMKNGRRIQLIQKPRAESDLAVAAASVIAREAFVRALKKMERDYGRPFPKGASPAVRKAGVELADKRGVNVLLDTAKCHFKTTDAILKEIGKDRSSLKREGQVTSKPVNRKFFKKA